MLCVVDDRPDKVESFSLQASEHFDVTVTKGLTLLTVRHYNDEALKEFIQNAKIILKQQTPETVQVLMKN